jgi:hypothetical protein
MRRVVASLILLAWMGAASPAQAQSIDQLATHGAAVTNADPLAVELRNRAPNDEIRRGFDIGMAAAEGQTLPGPGKQRIHDALPQSQQGGFDAALLFSFQRNRNAQFAATGAAIAKTDPIVAQARKVDSDVFYWLGFDIASGIFGDPASGAAGHTQTGPGSLGIRNALVPAAQRGFDASTKLHLSRYYHTNVLQGSGLSANTQMTPVGPQKPFDHQTRMPSADTQVVPYQGKDPRERYCAEAFALRRAPLPFIAAAYEPPFDEVHVFSIDQKGTLKDVYKPRDVWKHPAGFWEPSISLSAPGLAPFGSPLAAAWQPFNEQLEIFTIAPNGALQDIWKTHNGPWHAPIYISPPNFAPPSAHIAAIFQPINNTLEVFAVDATGTVRVAWKAQNGDWQLPYALTLPGSAAPGAPLAAVWQPLNEQLEVFWIDTTGAVREVLKQHNGAWQPPAPVSQPQFAGAGAELTAIWQPLNEQLEVFAVDRCGNIKDVWKAHNSAWFAPVVIYPAGDVPTGAPLIALWGAQFSDLQVFAVSLKGQIVRAQKKDNGRWSPGATGLYRGKFTPDGVAPPGAPLAIVQATTDQHFEMFTIDSRLGVQALSNVATRYSGGQVWSPPQSITRPKLGPIYGLHAAFCSRIARDWSNGDDLHEDDNAACLEFMGINAYCKSHDAFVGVGYPPRATLPRFLICSPIGHRDSPGEQVLHIGNGVLEGLITAAPYVALGVQAYACADGVVFACATIAVDLASRAGVVPDEVRAVYGYVNDAQQCSNGDVVACSKLGVAGAKALHIDIPGEDIAEVALLAERCRNNDFAACLRFGEMAAGAAGVPVDAINLAAINARKCFDGDELACIALGEQAADVRIPNALPGSGVDLNGLILSCSPDGVNTVDQAKRNFENCKKLGQTLAAVPR